MQKGYNLYNVEPQFRNFLTAENISPGSLKNYLSDFRYFAGWLDLYNKSHNPQEKDINKIINSEAINEYRSYLVDNKLPRQTINRRLSTVRRFCSFCISQGWLKKNPAKHLSNVSAFTPLDKASLSPENIKIRKPSFWEGVKRRLQNRKLPVISSEQSESRDLAKREPSFTLGIQHYVGLIIILVFMATLGAGIYNQFFTKSQPSLAFPTTLTRAGRLLSFQGRLTDSLGNPITTATNVTYKLYSVSTGGTALYTAGACSTTPDQDGIFSTLIGGSGYSPTPPQDVCGSEIDSSIFSENANVYLGVTVGADAEMTPRQQIANVGYAINAETLQGLPPGANTSNIPYINSDGNLLIAAASPGIRSTYTSTDFTLSSAKAAVIQAAGAGDIILQATESGTLKFRTGGATDAYTRIFVDNTGLVGIGTTGPGAKLDIASGVTALVIGADNNVENTRTNLTQKTGRMGLYHYTNAEEPMALFITTNTSGTGSIAFGGGTSTMNAATQLLFFTAANTTTTTGTEAMRINSSGNVGIGDTSPAALFTVGNGDLFQVDSSGNIKGPTLALGTGTIAPTDRLFNINTSTALTNAVTYTGTIQRTLTGTLTGDIANDYGLYNQLTINAADSTFNHASSGIYNITALSNGNTTDTIRGIYSLALNNSATISPDPAVANTATVSAAIQGVAYNNAAGIITNQYGGTFSSFNNSTGSITNSWGSLNQTYNNNATGTIGTAYGANNKVYTNLDGASITTAYGTYGQVSELAAQTTGGITTGYGGYFNGQDATTAYGLYAQGLQNTANTETFTNLYGIRNDCLSNGTNITVTNCYGINSSITETLGTITNGYAGYFNTSAALSSAFGLYSNITGASTTNYGLYTNVSGAGTNWSIYGNGSAASYLGGDLQLDNQSDLRLLEGDAGGSNYTGFQAPATLAGDVLYTLPSADAGVSGYVLSSNASGTLSWVEQTGGGGESLWTITNGAIYPVNSTVDAFIGGTASDSAKFAFLNVNSGTPTASISGNLAIAAPSGSNPATTYDILNGGTYNLRTSVGGDTGLISRLYIENDGDVGIGTTGPDAKLDVLATSGEQLRLTYTDGSVYSGLTLDSSGNLTIDGTGTKLVIADDLQINGNDILDSAAATRITLGATTTLTNTTTALSGTSTLTASSLATFTTAASLSMGSTTTLTLGSNATINGGTAANDDLTLQGTTNATRTTSYVNLQPNGGLVGIGIATPTYLLHVNGDMIAETYYDLTSSVYYMDPAGASNLGGNITMVGDLTMTDGTPTISSLLTGSYSTIVIKGSNDTTSASVCIEGTGTGVNCNGKLNVGTVDPPYTINGKKYATYLPSMTGVKEETTGKITLNNRDKNTKTYYRIIDFNNQPDESDLWLFAKATDLRKNINQLTVLLSSSNSGKVWYNVDPGALTLTIFSNSPSEVSYRLSAPRFDSSTWANIRDKNDPVIGFVINDEGNFNNSSSTSLALDQPVLSGVDEGIVYDGNINNFKQSNSFFELTGDFIEQFISINEALIARLKAGFIETENMIVNKYLVVNEKINSPVVETNNLKVTDTAELNKIETNEIKPEDNNLTVDLSEDKGELAKLIIKGLEGKTVTTIDAAGNVYTEGDISARSASFSGQIVAQSLSINNDATVSGTLYAKELQTNEASISGKLKAGEIESDNLTDLTNRLAATASNSSALATNVNEIQALLADIQNNPASDPNNYQNLSEEQFNDLTIEKLTVTGNSNLYNVSVSNSLLVGTTLIEQNSVTSLASELKLSALSKINLFDGAVTIAKDGAITTQGELIAQGGIRTNEIRGLTDQSKVNINNLSVNNLAISDKYLEATDSAAIVAAAENFDRNGVFAPAIESATASAGIAILPANQSEVIIYNDRVKNDSLIYLTPSSPVPINSQLTVVKKEDCNEQPVSCKKYFKIGVDPATDKNINFNWLIVN